MVEAAHEHLHVTKTTMNVFLIEYMPSFLYSAITSIVHV